MSIPLPAIISGAASLLTSPNQAPAVSNPDPTDSKPFVICATHDIPTEDLLILQSYGKVKSYKHDIHANISPATMDFSYLFLDFRSEKDRLYFQQQVLPLGLAYHVVLYKYSFESDLGVSYESEFASFPSEQATKSAYDALLLTPPLGSPSCVKDLFLAVAKCGAH